MFLENGERGSGLGCDDTSEPLRELRLRPVLVPTRPAPGSRFGWLRYEGRWGEKEKSFNDGPQGPNTKTQWLKPFEKQDEMRSSSAQLPGGAIGTAVTGAFCGTVAAASSFVNLAADTPPGAIALGLGALLLVAVPVGVTRWRPVEPEPLRRPRANGQLLRTASRLYRRHWKSLVPLGLTSIPIVGVFQGLRWLIDRATGDSDVVGAVGSAGVGQTLSGSLVSVGTSVGLAVVSAAVVTFVRELERGRVLGFVDAYRETFPRFWRAAFSRLIAALMVILLLVTIIGIPFAIRKWVDWQLVQQEILFEERSLREAFRGSSRLVRGHWWHTLGLVGFLWLLGVIAGPLLGFALIFTTLSPTAINLFGSLVFALLLPYLALGATLLYLDLAGSKAATSV